MRRLDLGALVFALLGVGVIWSLESNYPKLTTPLTLLMLMSLMWQVAGWSSRRKKKRAQGR